MKQNQEFLLQLSGEKHRLHRKAEMDKKHEALKRDWIMRHKADPDLDYDIVFKDDDEIHDNIKMNFSFLTQVPAGQDKATHKRTNREWRAIHASIPDSEWEQRFEQLMKLSLVDVPDDYYRDELFFTDPEELGQIFFKL